MRSDPGGVRGRLTLAGGTLGGTLDFAPAGQAQRIDAHLTANGASFPAFAVRSGRADGTIILADERTTIQGSLDARGITAGAISLARLTANASLVNGSGQVRAAFAGRRGAAFAFTTAANVSPNEIHLTGSGRIERQPLVLNQAAVLTRSGDGWELAPTSLKFAGGTANVSGRSGSHPEVHAQVQAMPLEVLDICVAQARSLGLGQRPRRLCLEGQSQRQAEPDHPRPQPSRPCACVQADRRWYRSGRE